MRKLSPRTLALVALVASVLGLTFALYSTYDYAEHLDRQVHAVHCRRAGNEAGMNRWAPES